MNLILTQWINVINLANRFGAEGDKCSTSGFLGFPKWYKYLDATRDAHNNCMINIISKSDSNGLDLNRIWLIGLAVIEVALRIGALVAIGFVIYGGFQYMLSQGEPDRTTAARQTILNAIIGLVITVLATVAVSFLGSQLGG